MVGWIHIPLVAASTGLFILLFLFFHHLFRHPKPPQPPVAGARSPPKPLFNWSDNPALVTDAIENGWSRFAFTEHISSSSSSLRSNRFPITSCVGDATGGDADDVDIIWEVCQGSSDFMQKIRLNSGLNNIVKTTASAMTAASAVRSALPLPGPVVGNSTPFPQEAYFEITILSIYEGDNGGDVNGKGRVNTGEDENVNLIEESGGNEGGVIVNIEEYRGRSCAKDIVEGGNALIVKVSVGLTGVGSLPVKLPGSFPGSIGFNSDGSVYMDGIRLVSESNIDRWEKTDKVIGCGYNPSQKKVFFTVDSKLIHEINCKGEEFMTSLYPTIAANSDVMVLVNFGQSAFKYAPANLQRTQNPCFVGPMANSPSLGYEDSKELFSMGRIDSQWLNQSTTRSGPYLCNLNKKDLDETSEADLFEIIIESNSYKKSPSTPS